MILEFQSEVVIWMSVRFHSPTARTLASKPLSKMFLLTRMPQPSLVAGGELQQKEKRKTPGAERCATSLQCTVAFGCVHGDITVAFVVFCFRGEKRCPLVSPRLWADAGGVTSIGSNFVPSPPSVLPPALIRAPSSTPHGEPGHMTTTVSSCANVTQRIGVNGTGSVGSQGRGTVRATS